MRPGGQPTPTTTVPRGPLLQDGQTRERAEVMRGVEAMSRDKSSFHLKRCITTGQALCGVWGSKQKINQIRLWSCPRIPPLGYKGLGTAQPARQTW